MFLLSRQTTLSFLCFDYRTCVRKCQDIFSDLFVTNTQEKFKCFLYVSEHCPESLHRIVRRIGLNMCFFCYHHSDACETSPHGGCLQFGHRYSRNCHFHCFTRKNKRAAHRPPNIISITQKLWKCLFSFYQKSVSFSYGTSHLEKISIRR